MRAATLLLLPLLAAAMATPVLAQQPAFLPYLNARADGAPILRPPTLSMSINGGPARRAIMDTGSTGVVVSASAIPGFDQLTPLGPGELTYTSSGRIMRGVNVMVPVTVTGADGTSVTTQPIPVLAVTRIDCLRNARSCRPIDAPRRVSMLGIGFARAKDRQPGAGPARNPFLNVAGMGQTGTGTADFKRGYVVTRRGVQVGLAQGDGEAFSKVKLGSDAATGDWQPIPACLSLNGRTPAACGTMLLDTGVSVMYLTLPPAQTDGLDMPGLRGGRVVMDGASLAIAPGEGQPAPAYGFTVGDRGNPVTPARVILVGRGDRPAFVNTTVRALNAFDYLFDADAGEAGFRAVGR